MTELIVNSLLSYLCSSRQLLEILLYAHPL